MSNVINLSNPPLPNGCIVFACGRAPLMSRDGQYFCSHCGRNYGDGTGAATDWDAIIAEIDQRNA